MKNTYRATIPITVEITATDREMADRLCNRVIEQAQRITVSKQWCDGHGSAAVTTGVISLLRSVPTP